MIVIPTINRLMSGFEAERPVLKQREFRQLGSSSGSEPPLSAWGQAVNKCCFADAKQREKMPFTYSAMKDFKDESPRSLPVLEPFTVRPAVPPTSIHESGDIKPPSYDPKFTR